LIVGMQTAIGIIVPIAVGDEHAGIKQRTAGRYPDGFKPGTLLTIWIIAYKVRSKMTNAFGKIQGLKFFHAIHALWIILTDDALCLPRF